MHEFTLVAFLDGERRVDEDEDEKVAHPLEILEQTEADSKDIFRYYSSQRMKVKKSLRLKKDNVYMAQVAI